MTAATLSFASNVAQGKFSSQLLSAAAGAPPYSYAWTAGFANSYGLQNGLQIVNGTSVPASQPAVPLTTVPVTNTNAFPVSVVITGGTMTNVKVAGVTVGAGAGTYTVPAGATIVMTFTVAPTWVWNTDAIMQGAVVSRGTGTVSMSITITDSAAVVTPLVVSLTVTDGFDAEGIHSTIANAALNETVDQFDERAGGTSTGFASPLSAGDSVVRMWPLQNPLQN